MADFRRSRTVRRVFRHPDWLLSPVLSGPVSPLLPVYSCALLRDILLQGRLYISRNWLCFYANLFGKDIKVGGVSEGAGSLLLFLPDRDPVSTQVAIPVVSVRLVKKHKTAGLVPNGLAITTDTGRKVNTPVKLTPMSQKMDRSRAGSQVSIVSIVS